jgi:hypothetical protein
MVSPELPYSGISGRLRVGWIAGLAWNMLLEHFTQILGFSVAFDNRPKLLDFDVVGYLENRH